MIAVACLLSSVVHGQAAKSTVPDLHLAQQKTVTECRQEIAGAGLRTGVIIELGDSPFYDDFHVIRQFPQPGEELTDGHLMHLAVSPLVDPGPLQDMMKGVPASSSSPFAESTWTIVALVELILILVLIFLLVLTKTSGARS